MSSIHFFIIIFFFFLFKIANFNEETEADKAEFNEDEDREYKFSKYFVDDGSCAVIHLEGGIYFFEWTLFEGGESNGK